MNETTPSPLGACRERGRVLPRCDLATLFVHWYRNIFSHVPAIMADDEI
jgi:hypothetical protein